MRLAALRRELTAATSADECLPPLAGLVDLAEVMLPRGGDFPAAAGRVLDEVLSYLRAVHPQLSAVGPDRLVALYVEASACLLRDSGTASVSDLDNAISCLRRLRAALPAGDPDLTAIDVKLAAAVFTRAGRTDGASADMRDARELLTGALDGLAPGDPRRPGICAGLAAQCAVGFAAFGGTQADRAAGIAYAGECLASPGEDADIGHFALAWMALTRQFSTGQRSAMYRQSQISATLQDSAAASAYLAEMGDFVLSSDDAATALTHLRQISAAPANDAVRGMLPMLWLTALAGTAEAADQLADDFQRLDDAVEQGRATADEGAPDHVGLFNVLPALAALLDRRADGSESLERFSDALHAVVTQLPEGHPARSVGIGLFSAGLGLQADKAVAAQDPAGQVGRIMAALSEVAPADPEVARTTLSVGLRLYSLGAQHRSVMQDEKIGPQFKQAFDGLAADDPLRPVADFTYWVSICLKGTLRQQPDVVDSGIGELKRCADALPAGHVARTYALLGVAIALMDRHSMGGEMRHLEEARGYLARALDSADPAGAFADGTAGYGALLYARAHLELMWCNYGPDLRRISAAVADLERAAPMTEGNDALRVSITSELEVARALLETTSAAERGAHLGPAARQAFDRLLETAATLGPDHPEYPTVLSQAANGLMLRGIADKEPRLMDQAIALLADACRVPRLVVRERPRLLALHGFALQTRYTHGGKHDPRDLSNAIGRLEEARRAVEQEVGSPYAAETLQTLAAAYRLRGDAGRGDVDRAVTYGLAGLREHVGDVLLQESDESALHVARRGTSDAAEMTRWFLARGRDAAAISALELGRGMVLHAATSGTSLPEALRAAGHAELADEWATTKAGSEPAPDLRYRAMLAIERSPVEARLLSAPSVGEIAKALAEADADALVYLLPRDDGGPGLAVVVDRYKGVRGLPLLGLPADDGEPVRGFLQARRAAEQTLAPSDISTWHERLGELCDWAWKTAIGPLLAAIPDGGRGADRRIVLVPCGRLGLVPWHAARQPGSGGYACQRAVVSYASSARQFIDATRCRPRPWPEAPVLIADSSPSLPLTAASVRHLFAGHYRAASVYGYARSVHGELPRTVPGKLAAAGADVLAALPGADTAGSSMLHFGCHGRTQVPVLRSYLDLGEQEALRVQDILRRARARQSGQPAACVCGLVVLASCLSDVTDADYDEALTLATAFMSAGVGGVIAARWIVEQNVTALFMTMFHQYLNVGGLRPPQALRAAQLWMLDPGRKIPPGLPPELLGEAELAGEPDGPDLVNPAAWAAFAYQGR